MSKKKLLRTLKILELNAKGLQGKEIANELGLDLHVVHQVLYFNGRYDKSHRKSAGRVKMAERINQARDCWKIRKLREMVPGDEIVVKLRDEKERKSMEVMVTKFNNGEGELSNVRVHTKKDDENTLVLNATTWTPPRNYIRTF